MKGNIPFCIEATGDSTTYQDEVDKLQSEELWNNTCVSLTGTSHEFGTYNKINCAPSNLNSVRFEIHDHGCAIVLYRKEDHSTVKCSANE